MKKRNKIIYWIATIWLSFGMTVTAVVQLSGAKIGAGGADSIKQLGYPLYLLTILGIWKILGVITILIPKFPLVKEWAYAGFFFAMSGAFISHLAAGSPANELIGSLLSLVLIVVSWYFRPADRRLVPANQ